MVATSQPIASATALRVLSAGGNAIDAAVAACAVLGVVEPHQSGVGGDCFALIAPQGSHRIVSYNGSGRAPRGADIRNLASAGASAIDPTSVHSVTIPGAVDAWCRLVKDHGTLSIAEVLAPAIDLAERGFPVAERVAYDWRVNAGKIRKRDNLSRFVLQAGDFPNAGDILRSLELAQTLRAIAGEGPSAFYEGPVAANLVDFLRLNGGTHTREDFSSHTGEYSEPLVSSYRQYSLFQCPPNGPGILAQIILEILQGFDLGSVAIDSAARYHLLIEATKLVAGIRDLHLADASSMQMSTSHLLSPGYVSGMRKRVRLDRLSRSLQGSELLQQTDTTYVAVVDKERNAISIICSLYEQFGSGLRDLRTGVVLQNRGISFSLDPKHVNCLAPRKRPLHSIMPGMLCHDGKFVMAYGVVGGPFQPCGHADLLTALLDHGLDLQRAIDLPRVLPLGGIVQVEGPLAANLRADLAELGHRIEPANTTLGGAQAIWLDRDTNGLSGASDGRKDGCAIGF